MLKRIGFLIITFSALIALNRNAYTQDAHFGLYFSAPHIRIVAGEPVYYHYPLYYPAYHHRHYYGVRPYYGHYYSRRHYYHERYRYRHDRGWHRGWHKHRHH